MTSESGDGKKRATIWEVARFAGVSHQTVSRYLRNEGGLRPTTREKIDRAVAELDYKPNLIARSMRTRRSNRIAIVLPELTTFVPLPGNYELVPAPPFQGTAIPIIPPASVRLTISGTQYTATMPTNPSSFDRWLNGPYVMEGRSVVTPVRSGSVPPSRSRGCRPWMARRP